MSIATAITDLSGRIQDAYTALAAKGATMPATRNSYNLSSTIDTVPTGGGGSVYGISSAYQIIGRAGTGGVGIEWSDPFDAVLSGWTSTEESQFSRLFDSNGNIRSVSFPDLQTIDAEYSLEYLCNNASNCSAAYFPSLTTITLNGATSPHSGASYVLRQAFSGTQVRSITFPELKTMIGRTAQGLVVPLFRIFGNNIAGDLYFPKVDNIAGYFFYSGCPVTMHFAASNRAAVEAGANYSNKFGATDGTILFDL